MFSSTLKHDLFALGAHIGHFYTDSYKMMTDFIVGICHSFIVLDIDKSIIYLKKALLACSLVFAASGKFLFSFSDLPLYNVSIKSTFINIINRSRQSFVYLNWVPGCVSNYGSVFTRFISYFMPEVVDSFRKRNEYWTTSLTRWYQRSVRISKSVKKGVKLKGYKIYPTHRQRFLYKKKYINTLHYYIELYRKQTAYYISNRKNELLKNKKQKKQKKQKEQKKQKRQWYIKTWKAPYKYNKRMNKKIKKKRYEYHLNKLLYLYALFRISRKAFFFGPENITLYVPSMYDPNIEQKLHYNYNRKIAESLGINNPNLNNPLGTLLSNVVSQYWDITLLYQFSTSDLVLDLINHFLYVLDNTSLIRTVLKDATFKGPFYKYLLCAIQIIDNASIPTSTIKKNIILVVPLLWKQLFGTATIDLRSTILLLKGSIGINYSSLLALYRCNKFLVILLITWHLLLSNIYFLLDTSAFVDHLYSKERRRTSRARSFNKFFPISSKHRHKKSAEKISKMRLKFRRSKRGVLLPKFKWLFIRSISVTNTLLFNYEFDHHRDKDGSYFRRYFRKVLVLWKAIIFFRFFRRSFNVPDCLFIMNPRSLESHPNEFVTLNLPVFGIVDSNSDVSKVTYPIPCNDDSIILLLFFVLLFTNQCIDINLRCKIKLLEVA